MYIYAETEYDESDGRNYVRFWKLLNYKKYSETYPDNVHIIYITKVLSDFYIYPHHYYVDDTGALRKNPHRVFR
jgi:hypothetical protein